MRNFLSFLSNMNIITLIIISVITVTLICFICYKYRVALIWYIKELIATCSNKDSYFSQKRIIQWIAIGFAFNITIWYLREHIETMVLAEFMWMLSTWLFIGGYTLDKIQKEKKDDKVNPPEAAK